MTSTTSAATHNAPPPPAEAAPGSVPLRGRRLPSWGTAAIAAACIVVSLLLFAVTPLAGRADWIVFTVVLFAVTQTAVSFAVEGRRHAVDRLGTLFVRLALFAALLPLVAVLGYTLAKGAGHLSGSFLSHSMKGVASTDTNGGEYHAIVGTLEQVALTTLMAVPLGLLVAVYITEFGGNRLASIVRFVVDVMTGIPSIVAGLFVFAFWGLALGNGFSGFAASLALAILMLPVVVRSSEEMIRLVPDSLREASYALGIPRWKTILRIVLPTASAGITTGVMLAVARVTGETAPILLTAQLQPGINTDPFHERQASIPVYIFDQIGQGNPDINFPRAWAAAVTLIILVVALYVGARLITRRNQLTS